MHYHSLKSVHIGIRCHISTEPRNPRPDRLGCEEGCSTQLSDCYSPDAVTVHLIEWLHGYVGSHWVDPEERKGCGLRAGYESYWKSVERLDPTTSILPLSVRSYHCPGRTKVECVAAPYRPGVVEWTLSQQCMLFLAGQMFGIAPSAMRTDRKALLVHTGRGIEA